MEGSACRLSDFKTCFLSGVMKLGIQGVLEARVVVVFSFGASPSSPNALRAVLAFLLTCASWGEEGATGALWRYVEDGGGAR